MRLLVDTIGAAFSVDRNDAQERRRFAGRAQPALSHQAQQVIRPARPDTGNRLEKLALLAQFCIRLELVEGFKLLLQVLAVPHQCDAVTSSERQLNDNQHWRAQVFLESDRSVSRCRQSCIIRTDMARDSAMAEIRGSLRGSLAAEPENISASMRSIFSNLPLGFRGVARPSRLHTLPRYPAPGGSPAGS